MGNVCTASNVTVCIVVFLLYDWMYSLLVGMLCLVLDINGKYMT